MCTPNRGPNLKATRVVHSPMPHRIPFVISLFVCAYTVPFAAAVSGATSAPPTGPLPRTDGRCGPNYGSAPCTAGNCCSLYGYCGSGPEYCGTTAPRADGRCGPSFGNAGCSPGNCCSQYGYCGSSSSFCNSMSIYPVNPVVTTKRPTTRSAPVPTPAQRCGTGLPLCNPGNCCSQWGYCGSTIDYCNAQSMYPMVPFPKPTTPAPTVLKIAPAAQACGTSLPLCPVGSCCSQWGFCGTTSDYCNSASVYQAVTTPRPDGRCGLAFGNAGCASDQCCSPYGYCGSGSQYCSTAPPVPAAAQQSSIASLIPESVFDSLLSTSTTCEGHGVYTYSAFIQAASAFPLFGNQGTLQNRLTDIAGFLAHAVHESGSFCYVNELGYTTPATYCSQTPQWPCYPSANYHGRGPLQLSWNFNYIAFGQTLTSAQSVQLYQNPDMLSSSPDLLFRSALWFYMTPQSPKDSMHNVLIQSPPQFGQSISIINGGLECNGNNPAQAQDRISQFKRICQLLGCDPGPYLTC